MEKLFLPVIFLICIVANNYMYTMNGKPVGRWALQNGSHIEGKLVCKTLIQIQKLLEQETRLGNIAVLSLIVLCTNQGYAAETHQESNRDVRKILRLYSLVDEQGKIENSVKDVVESVFNLSHEQIRYDLITQNGGNNPVTNVLQLDYSQNETILPLRIGSPLLRRK